MGNLNEVQPRDGNELAKGCETAAGAVPSIKWRIQQVDALHSRASQHPAPPPGMMITAEVMKSFDGMHKEIAKFQ